MSTRATYFKSITPMYCLETSTVANYLQSSTLVKCLQSSMLYVLLRIKYTHCLYVLRFILHVQKKSSVLHPLTIKTSNLLKKPLVRGIEQEPQEIEKCPQRFPFDHQKHRSRFPLSSRAPPWLKLRKQGTIIKNIFTNVYIYNPKSSDFAIQLFFYIFFIEFT